MRYPVVLLDVGGTLVGPSASFGAVYSEVSRTLGLNLAAEGLERRIREVWSEMDRAIPPGADRYAWFPGGEDEYWLRFARTTLERASGTLLADDLARTAVERIREAFMDRAAWTVFPDVPPVLARLRADGVRMGIVSNWDSRLPHVLALLDLARHFEEIGVSCLEGCEKPDPRIFRRVLRRMNARAASALHVGDVPEIDLAGARAAGIAGVLVDRPGRLDRALRPLDDLTALPAIASGGLDRPLP